MSSRIRGLMAVAAASPVVVAQPAPASIPWYTWVRTSESLRADAEARLLRVVRTPFVLDKVPVHVDGVAEQEPILINTLRITTDPDMAGDVTARPASASAQHRKPPLVLVHGMAGGVGIWIKSFDRLAEHFDIYALDLIGFGGSSRPRLAFKSAEDAEALFLDTLEQWRQHMGLDRFHLLGHSFGGYLAAAYACRHADRVDRLVLADPWGMTERPIHRSSNLPWWGRALKAVFGRFPPLAILRGLGPAGPALLPRVRADLANKLADVLEDTNDLFDYIYHSNAAHPTGEVAFGAMSVPIAWAKSPMTKRLLDNPPPCRIACIYGQRTWMDKAQGQLLQQELGSQRVFYREVPRAGHHLHWDNADDFNDSVLEALRAAPERDVDS